MEIAWEALLAASTVFFLGAISPGPSLLMVIRNTIVGGRRRGVMCAIGHGIGFGLYAGIAIFGLIVLLEQAPEVFLVLQIIGILLLIWYGYLMWIHAENEYQQIGDGEARGFLEGFSIAFFNPKIALFLVAVLAQVLDAGMGLATKLSIGFVGMAIDMIWYVLVALLLTGTPLLEWLRTNGKAVNRTTAVVLWGFAISVVVSTVLAS
ncbi:LysE family translocator [Candidatus Poseidoniales archaeon]|nr:LysE family translocator [Candidatus Poseidoniales archaeon]MDC0285519.1 LysE family translocator [Candidatus Poseidoniaceae archaeon]MDA8716272.1 LysE family translocator [Candidatus Poseidoniales archaeon]MDA8718308.1 LysE family translocator [Candidatus Poseidoniales archaeon]MDB2333701.1 LysE family translocator [Candidatus Poseidoniales archaeon]|tara:strand:+ start:5312 stop:5932 length:621 start_codon:yes stop_codon:yes gene_type:complete